MNSNPRHVKDIIDDSGARVFEYPPAHTLNSCGGAPWFNSDPFPTFTPTIIDWHQFHQFLLQRMTSHTAEDRIRYAKQFVSVLTNGDAHSLLVVPPNKRIHIMKALSSLACYTGSQDLWRQVRQRHGLQWSTGTEKLDAFTRFFDDSRSLDNMLHWLREAISALPPTYSHFLLFCTLTGLRGSECVEAVRLLNRPDSQTSRYYNPEQQILQHYRFPELFIRRTKAVYIVVNDQIIAIAKAIGKTPP